ncbi:MAG: hypothetical protein WC989_01355 [Micavibrio sp.]
MKASHDLHNNTRSGSVLIIILVAVALFAALSYAVFRDGGSGAATRTMGDAQARLFATELIAYADSIARAVQKLRISGCSENELDFANDVWSRRNGDLYYKEGHNSNSRAGCGIFKSGEGGIRAVAFPADNLKEPPSMEPTNTVTGHSLIIRSPIPGVGREEDEEIIYRIHAIPREVCLKLNDMAGVGNPNGEPPSNEGAQTGNRYNGIFYSRPIMPDPSGALHGKRAFCANVKAAYDHDFIFFRAVLVR